MMLVEDFKKDISNSLKEIQENTNKQVEALKEETHAHTHTHTHTHTHKSLKELHKNTTKQVKDLNKTIQHLKMEIETIKKSQRGPTAEIENLGKKSRAIDASITNRIKEMEERISSAENSIENIDKTIKENAKCKKILTQNIQEIQDTLRRPNLRIIGIDENEDFQLKGPVNVFDKIIEHFPNLKKKMPMNIQVANKGRPIRITPDFSPETVKTRR
jgi:chromosome segregation ATPase